MPDTFLKSWDFGDYVDAVAITRDEHYAAFALVDGTCHLLDLTTGELQRISLHPNGGGLLSFCLGEDEQSFLATGDDGTVVRLVPSAAAQITVLATHKGKWPNHICASPIAKTFAYAVGKEVYVGNRQAPLTHDATVEGLAFHPNGKRLAATHFGGASLWWLNAKDSTPTMLGWAGAHLKAVWHPSGDFLMTNMQDNTLHGWNLALKEKDKAGRDIRMAGYGHKVGSFGFSSGKARWLVTSGADQIICWPFFGGGPQGKPPLAIGMPEGYPVSVVAPQPDDELTAAGYASGRLVICPIEDCLPIELLPPTGEAITALNWSASGRYLLCGSESGAAYLFSTQSIIKGTEHLMSAPSPF